MEAREELDETEEAREQQDVEIDDSLSEAMNELASRVQHEEKLTDMFGVDDSFVDNVINKAYGLYKAGQFEQAQVLIVGACALDPTRSYPRLLAGDICLRLGEVKKAREQFERAYELDEQDMMTASKLGEACLRSGDREWALELLQHVADHADSEAPYTKRAIALLNSATPVEAAGE